MSWMAWICTGFFVCMVAVCVPGRRWQGPRRVVSREKNGHSFPPPSTGSLWESLWDKTAGAHTPPLTSPCFQGGPPGRMCAQKCVFALPWARLNGVPRLIRTDRGRRRGAEGHHKAREGSSAAGGHLRFDRPAAGYGSTRALSGMGAALGRRQGQMAQREGAWEGAGEGE